jgi:LuxR family maltose regulon positive regulatory protein
VLVLDNCEQIQRSQRATRLVSAFLDYLPGGVRVILSSREQPGLSVGRMRLQRRLGYLGDDELAFDLDEVRRLLDAEGRADLDAEAALRSTGGWAAGLVFHADIRLGGGGDASALSDYFDSEVLDRLPADERAFLLDTSVLDSVTVSDAEIMCGPEGPALWRAIVSRHLPATTTTNLETVYHPCFRDHLRSLLSREDPRHIADLCRRKAFALRQVGRDEDAVEQLLLADDLDEAATVAIDALPSLYLRADWDVALRWLDRLGDERVAAEPALQAARVRALAGSARMHEAREYVGELDRSGVLDRLAAADPGVVAYFAWVFQSKTSTSLDLIETEGGDFRSEGLA